MLQVFDELDDAVGTLRHRWLGFQAQTGQLLSGRIGIAVRRRANAGLDLPAASGRARSG